jgi:hypothetical protein
MSMAVDFSLPFLAGIQNNIVIIKKAPMRDALGLYRNSIISIKTSGLP